MMTRCSRISVAAVVMLASFSFPSLAEETKRFPLSASYKEECGSCHVPYPPQLLPASSWKAIMEKLDRHFGSDASLDPAKAREISGFLSSNAGRADRANAPNENGKPNLRITDTSWFKREHRAGREGISEATWKSPAVKSPSNCEACHREASKGIFSEEGIRIPRAQ